MYIEPNTIIRVLKDCPLDNTYNHTIYFNSASAQTAYFQNLTKYTFADQSYQRVQRGKMRVQRKAEDLYDCNYLMFQNSSFGTKWFYAFITSVEYVNNVTSEIVFEIDVMQTWFFDYQLKECFVEREHSATDVIGANLIPEKLELGDYVADSATGTQQMGDYSIVVACTFDENYDDTGGGYYAGTYSGLTFIKFDNDRTGASEAEEFIMNARDKTEGIVAVFLMPTAFAVDEGASITFHTITKNKSLSSIGGYVPRNKKLLTYPYNFLYVSNNNGNSAVFKYEYFDSDDCKFQMFCDMSPNPTVILAPQGYKGIGTNFDEKLTLTGFPQLPYTTDSFKAWLAQSAGNVAVDALSSAAQYAVAGSFAGGVGAFVGATVGFFSSVLNTIGQTYTASIQPDQAHGGSGSTAMVTARQMDYIFMPKHIRPEFARIIDDFFDMFGYATNRVKVPNRNSRPHWNYVKTIGCVVTGSVPADDMNSICSIYNNGITFWKNGSEVGNYSLDNRP